MTDIAGLIEQADAASKYLAERGVIGAERAEGLFRELRDALARLTAELVEADKLAVHHSDRADAAEAKTGWRCFHCSEVFTDVAAAQDHFGPREWDTPACLIDANHVREVEEQLARYQSEGSDVDRQFHAMRADHAQALIREEEKGYSRGIADMRSAREAVEAKLVRIDAYKMEWRDKYYTALARARIAETAHARAEAGLEEIAAREREIKARLEIVEAALRPRPTNTGEPE